MFGIGMTELVVILVVALIVFGPTRLPELARSLGRAMGEFRRASTDLRQTFNESIQDPKPAPAPVPPTPVIAPPDPVASAEPAKTAERDPSGTTA
jgi:sec-independent protein translocase protein TatB